MNQVRLLISWNPWREDVRVKRTMKRMPAASEGSYGSVERKLIDATGVEVGGGLHFSKPPSLSVLVELDMMGY